MFSCNEINKKRNENEAHFYGKLLICQKFLREKYGNNEHLILVQEFPRKKESRADLVLLDKNSSKVEVWVEIQDTKITKKDLDKKIEYNLKVGNKEMLYIIGLTSQTKNLYRIIEEILVNKSIRHKIFYLDYYRWKLIEL